MPDIELPADGEKPYGTKLRTAINAVNDAVDAATEAIADGSAVTDSAVTALVTNPDSDTRSEINSAITGVVQTATFDMDTQTTAARRAAVNAEAAGQFAPTMSKLLTGYSGVFIGASYPSHPNSAARASSVLTAGVSLGASSFTVSSPIVPGRYTLGTENVVVSSITGASSPYTVTLSAPLGIAHPTTTLAAASSVGASTLSLTSSVSPGSYLVGTEIVNIVSVTGSGPYTATLSVTAGSSHSSGDTVTPRIVTRELDYQLIRGIGAGRFLVCELTWKSNTPPSYTWGLNQLGKAYVALAMLSVDETDASIVRAGTWASQGVNPATFGGTYRYTTTAGATASWTTPVSCTSVGWRGVRTGNGGGLAKVTIDGDATLANLLPTAQDVVTQGIFPNTILVANGGTLNPTDRVLHSYSSILNWDERVPLADGLANTSHSIVLTSTGYQATASSGNRFYLSGLSYGNTSVLPSAAGAALFQFASIHDEQNVESAWEYAIEMKLGTGSLTFVGNIHGYERQDSISILVGDATSATNFTAGQIVAPAAGEDITITRQSSLFHPDSLNTPIYTFTTTYTLTRNGLRVRAVPTRIASNVSWGLSYMMLPANGVGSTSLKIDRVAFLAGKPYTLPGTSDTRYGRSKSAAAWVWSLSGNVAAALWLPDVFGFTADWSRNGGAQVSVQDRAGLLTKIYAAKTGPRGPYPAPDGEVFEGVYIHAYLPGGAEAVLGGS